MKKAFLVSLCALVLFQGCKKDENYGDGTIETETEAKMTYEENLAFIDNSVADSLGEVDSDEAKEAFYALCALIDKDKRKDGTYLIEYSGDGEPITLKSEQLGQMDIWEHTVASMTKRSTGKVVLSGDLYFSIDDGKTEYDFASGGANLSGDVFFGKQTLSGDLRLVRKKRLLSTEFYFEASNCSLSVPGKVLLQGGGVGEGVVASDIPLPETISVDIEIPGTLRCVAGYTDLITNKHKILLYYNGNRKFYRGNIHFNNLLRTMVKILLPSLLSKVSDDGSSLGYISFWEDNFTTEHPLEEAFTEENLPRTIPLLREYL